ncbi:MAG: ferrous iron transporter B [Propionibacteriaceae bacterium]|nr:ferrous iron transporter B [Propionibacteriaceae bacterium]
MKSLAWSERFDRWSTGRVSGPIILLVIMWVTFQLTTLIAQPLQLWLAHLFSGPVSDGATTLLRWMHLANTWVHGLVVNGIIAGVGTLLAFLPLMIIMFVLLSILEHSGYMARAAVTASGLMRRIGLPGEAFLPLIVGFGCNVPAVIATQDLADPRQRRLTALLVPFTSCSARLTVYMLVSSAFFGRWAGTAVFAMYVLSILLVVGVGWALRRAMWQRWPGLPMILDLPPVHTPGWRAVVKSAWDRVVDFLKTASGIIVAVVVVVWVLQAIPVGAGSFGDVALDNSLFAAVARVFAPLFAFAGFGAWHLVAPLVAGFAAKEAVVASLGQTFGGGDLAAALHTAFGAASGGHALAAAAAFLVFVLVYTPCAATVSALRHQVGGRWTAFGVALQLILAWVLAVVVFQIGRLL